MALINTAIPNLLGGVTQQPDSLREDTNCEEQVNAYPSPVQGLIKRPPVEFMTDGVGTDLGGLNSEDTATHLINRDTDERYILMVKGTGEPLDNDGGLVLWDIVNNEAKTVYFDEDSLDYLKATDPVRAFKFVTAGDVTFIVNSEIETAMTTDRSSQQAVDALVHVRQGAYDTEYKIRLNGEEVPYEVTDVSSTPDVVQTSDIASNLLLALEGGAFITTIDDNAVTLGSGGDVAVGTALTLGLNSANAMRFTTNFAVAAADTLIGQEITFDSIGTSNNTNFKYYYFNGYTTYNTLAIIKKAVYRIKRVDPAAPLQPTWVELEDVSGRDLLTTADATPYWGVGAAHIKIKESRSTSFPDFVFSRAESSILIHNILGEDFDISTSDSVGDTYIKAFKDETQYFSDLPIIAPDGFRIAITGNVESDIDDYHVKFRTRLNEPFGEGTWEETIGPVVEYDYDKDTMPHILIRQSDGTFLFKQADGESIPTNVTSGFTLPSASTEIGALDGAVTDNSWVIDGLTEGLEITPNDKISVGASGEQSIITGGIVEGGSVLLIVNPAFGALADNTAVNIHLKADYRPYNWEGRKVGDNETNPLPSFIGKTINNIKFFGGRLMLLAGENDIKSETGQFFNFFRTTVVDLLDTAPIDIASSSNTVSNLRHAIAMNGNLVLFSQDANQFTLGTGGEALTPSNVAMTQSSYYECDNDCEPVVIGSSIYFAYERGNFAGVKEMTVRDPNADSYQAFDVTDHVPQYLPNSMRSMVAMPQENLLVCLPNPLDEGITGSGSMEDVYIYKFLDRGDERLQSSWSKFSLSLYGDNTDDEKQIIGIHVVDNVIYFICQYRKIDSGVLTNGGTYIYKMVIETGKVDDYSVFTTMLDSRVSYDGADGVGEDAVTAVYNGGTDVTTFTLPYGATSDEESDYAVITKAYSGDDGGVDIPILSLTQSATAAALRVTGDYTSAYVWLGKKYTMTYGFSKPILKGRTASGGSSLITTGRFQINAMELVFDDTNTFNVEVAADGRGTYDYTFLADIAKAGATLQGSIALDSDVFRIPIHSRNKNFSVTLSSDSVFPVKLLSAEYEAQYNARSRRRG